MDGKLECGRLGLSSYGPFSGAGRPGYGGYEMFLGSCLMALLLAFDP